MSYFFTLLSFIASAVIVVFLVYVFLTSHTKKIPVQEIILNMFQLSSYQAVNMFLFIIVLSLLVLLRHIIHVI